MSSQDSQTYHWHFSTELNDNSLEIHGRALFFMIVLFAVIVLIILLFLYARWVCRYQQQHFPSNPPVNAPHALPLRPQGLHSTLIKAIPITLYEPSSSSSSLGNTAAGAIECCICLGIFEDGDKVKILPKCNHCYHSECVDKWLNVHSSCPLCRAPLNCHSAVISILTE